MKLVEAVLQQVYIQTSRRENLDIILKQVVYLLLIRIKEKLTQPWSIVTAINNNDYGKQQGRGTNDD